MEDSSMMENVAPQAQQQEAVQQPVANVLSQEQVNRIVAREKAAAAEKARREAEERYKAELEQLRQAQQQRNEQVPRDVDADALYQQIQERFNKELQEKQFQEHMNQVANNYLAKVNAAKTNYEDFDDVTKDFDPSAFPQLTYLLSGIENAGDVLYDLAKNPLKLAGIDRLAEKNPRQAQTELLKLSQSIASNRQAQIEAANQTVSDPLDRLQPSRVSGSNNKMTIKDLRSQSWLKG